MLAAKQLQANESPFRIRKDLHIKEVAVPTYDLWWQCYFRNWNCNFLALANKTFTSYNLTNEHTTTKYSCIKTTKTWIQILHQNLTDSNNF